MMFGKNYLGLVHLGVGTLGDLRCGGTIGKPGPMEYSYGEVVEISERKRNHSNRINGKCQGCPDCGRRP